jgi:hypothetical protein
LSLRPLLSRIVCEEVYRLLLVLSLLVFLDLTVDVFRLQLVLVAQSVVIEFIGGEEVVGVVLGSGEEGVVGLGGVSGWLIAVVFNIICIEEVFPFIILIALKEVIILWTIAGLLFEVVIARLTTQDILFLFIVSVGGKGWAVVVIREVVIAVLGLVVLLQRLFEGF